MVSKVYKKKSNLIFYKVCFSRNTFLFTYHCFCIGNFFFTHLKRVLSFLVHVLVLLLPLQNQLFGHWVGRSRRLSGGGLSGGAGRLGRQGLGSYRPTYTTRGVLSTDTGPCVLGAQRYGSGGVEGGKARQASTRLLSGRLFRVIKSVHVVKPSAGARLVRLADAPSEINILC